MYVWVYIHIYGLHAIYKIVECSVVDEDCNNNSYDKKQQPEGNNDCADDDNYAKASTAAAATATTVAVLEKYSTISVELYTETATAFLKY